METEEALAYFGGARELADALGISHQAVYAWGKKVPPLRAYEIERLTDGQLTVKDAPKPTH